MLNNCPSDQCRLSCLLIAGLIALSVAGRSAAAQTRVYRDQVTPHWNQAGNSFWYRNELPDNHREFLLVEAEAGTRKPAFDHALVAAEFSELLGTPVQAEQLPVDSLEFAPPLEIPENWILVGPHGRFLWTQESSVLSRLEPVPLPDAELFLPVRPSGNATDETELIISNTLTEPLQLVWITSSGEQIGYGQVDAGETRRQHTFVSHVWMLRKSDGTEIGCLTAEPSRSEWRITAWTIENVRRDEPRRRRRTAPAAPDLENLQSPDKTWFPFVRDHNLHLRSLRPEGEEHCLTTDGVPENTFRKDAQRARGIGMDFDLQDYSDDTADVWWSPDSRWLLAMQTTQVPERRVHYVESSPADQLQPILHSYPYLKPGDAIPVSRPRLFRVADRTEIPVSAESFPDPWSLEFLRWSDDGSRFWLLYNRRGHQTLRVLEVLAATGAVRTVVDEHSDTFIHYSSEGKFELRWLPENRLLWASERSGWNHLYRVDLQTGDIINAVTSGNWNLRRVEHLDESAGLLWFYAVGIQSDQDPYHEHFCRVSVEGTDLRILTCGDGTHRIEWSPDHRWFLDRYSRVDLPPVTELRTAEGQLVCVLEVADAGAVLEERGRLPERFAAPGRDGTTEIRGIIHRPADFDPNLSYPVIENIYAGPHDHHVPTEFRAEYRHQQRIADQGFIVVQIDGMGTAWRSKAFHDVCWKNLKDAGFPDRIAWMKAAAAAIPQMDLTRVGIYGGSAGGQNAMAALLWHGDFYKAAVADCGCHDNRMDKIWWNEQWMGPPEGDHYPRNSNMENAERLQGRLLLVVGEMDRNVDPSTTLQVARRLIRADKDFELLIVPGAGHGACETPWASNRRLNFFQSSLGSPRSRQ